MAHFAEINTDNIVTNVIVIDNKDILDENNVEQEALGIAFIHNLYNDDTTVWVQTSYNNNFRKNYAGIGHTYDKTRDAFIPIQPYASWTLNETTCQWEAPTPYPDDDGRYTWDEDTLSWIEGV
tara:strand:+ start:1044 stop:1412 length:369 start_codon:yes stop_codon:yes gene_type:complete